MFAKDVELVVVKELESYIPGKFDRCSHELEDMLVREGGARDPIVAWRRGDELVVVDGHRRLAICKKHNLEFDLVEMQFASAREAKHWMDTNQFTRRNLNGHERAILIGRMDAFLEQEKAAGRFNGSVGQKIADDLKVTPRQVRRYQRDAEAIEKVAEPLRDKIVSGELKVSKATIKALSEMPEREQLNAQQQVEQGEFSTLGEAVTGNAEEAGNSGMTEAPSTRPAPKPSRTPGLKALGKQTIPSQDLDTIPMDSEPKGSHDVLADAIKALGMLGKAMDALNEQSPNLSRISSVRNHIASVRSLLKTWVKEAA
jgi:hypothetical protein